MQNGSSIHVTTTTTLFLHTFSKTGIAMKENRFNSNVNELNGTLDSTLRFRVPVHVATGLKDEEFNKARGQNT